jgi:splicing factor U2AF subunit
VTDFKEARCRQFDEGVCSRDGFCNFMHSKSVSNELRKYLLEIIRCPQKKFLT